MSEKEKDIIKKLSKTVPKSQGSEKCARDFGNIDELEIKVVTDEQIERLERTKALLADILDMKEKIASCFGNESAERAIQGAIDWKTKSGYRYLTYVDEGSRKLVLIDTENQSSIVFEVGKIVGGSNIDNFHPEKMFVGRPVKGC